MKSTCNKRDFLEPVRTWKWELGFVGSTYLGYILKI